MKTQTYTPLHEDQNLNDDWWHTRGYSLTGIESVVHRNFMRDGSGRFDGYGVVTSRISAVWPKTVFEAEQALVLIASVNEGIGDHSLKKGDTVYNKTWKLTSLEVVDVNWALKAAAVRLGPTGGIVVWPVAGLSKTPHKE